MAIALLGLICIGLVGLGGAVYLYQSTFAEQAALPSSPTIVVPVETPTITSTPTLMPTETPLPTATGTKVVAVSGEEVSVEDQLPAEETTQEPIEEPTATPTEGLALPTAAEGEAATATSTVVVETPTSESETAPATATTAPEMPGSGGILPANGSFLIWAGVAMLVVLLLGVWKQFRSSHLS